MATPFDYKLGVSQGRIQPVNAAVSEGEYLFCLGTDLVPAPKHNLAIGDEVQVQQDVDLTTVNFIRSVWTTRQPDEDDLPRRTVLPSDAYLQHGGIFPLDDLHARLAIGSGSGQVTYWADETGAGGESIRVAHVNPGPSNATTTVGVAGRDITVTLRTDGGGGILATADEVETAVRNTVAAEDLVSVVASGTGVVSAQALTNLALTSADVDALIVPSGFWTVNHRRAVVNILEAINPTNNGDKTVVGILDSQTALLGQEIISESPGFYAALRGARWEASLLVGGTMLASVIEPYGKTRTRTDMVGHVSKLTGVHTVSFRLRVVEELGSLGARGHDSGFSPGFG